jgi:hypothetical protein
MVCSVETHPAPKAIDKRADIEEQIACTERRVDGAKAGGTRPPAIRRSRQVQLQGSCGPPAVVFRRSKRWVLLQNLEDEVGFETWQMGLSVPILCRLAPGGAWWGCK